MTRRKYTSIVSVNVCLISRKIYCRNGKNPCNNNDEAKVRKIRMVKELYVLLSTIHSRCEPCWNDSRTTGCRTRTFPHLTSLKASRKYFSLQFLLAFDPIIFSPLDLLPSHVPLNFEKAQRTFTSTHIRNRYAPLTVAELSRTMICGISLAGIAGSNPTRGMDVYLL